MRVHCFLLDSRVLWGNTRLLLIWISFRGNVLLGFFRLLCPSCRRVKLLTLGNVLCLSFFSRHFLRSSVCLHLLHALSSGQRIGIQAVFLLHSRGIQRYLLLNWNRIILGRTLNVSRIGLLVNRQLNIRLSINWLLVGHSGIWLIGLSLWLVRNLILLLGRISILSVSIRLLDWLPLGVILLLSGRRLVLGNGVPIEGLGIAGYSLGQVDREICGDGLISAV